MTFLKKILLVDYQPGISAVIREALEETGKYLLKEEPECRHALSAARWFQPDLVLFDVNITTMDGCSAARQIQVDPEFRETLVVFLSVNSSFEGGIVSGGIGGYNFIANPVRLEEFVRYVEEVLSHTPEEMNAKNRGDL